MEVTMARRRKYRVTRGLLNMGNGTQSLLFLSGNGGPTWVRDEADARVFRLRREAEAAAARHRKVCAFVEANGGDEWHPA